MQKSYNERRPNNESSKRYYSIKEEDAIGKLDEVINEYDDISSNFDNNSETPYFNNKNNMVIFETDSDTSYIDLNNPLIYNQNNRENEEQQQVKSSSYVLETVEASLVLLVFIFSQCLLGFLKLKFFFFLGLNQAVFHHHHRQIN
jgi:hypothetical protein